MPEVPRHYQGLEYAVAPYDDITPEAFVYGSHPLQVCDLRRPPHGPVHGAVVLIHGGAWHVPWDRRQFNAVASHLARNGWMTWNVDHRAIGDKGEYPNILHDVLAAVTKLIEVVRDNAWDVRRCVVIGHSAGAQLAMWVSAHINHTASKLMAPGLRPTAAVSLGGILDLRGAMAQPAVAGMVAAFLEGGSQEQPERYAEASPLELVPIGVPQLVVHGRLDDMIPGAQAVAYVDAARRAGDRVAVMSPDIGHMGFLNPRASVWNDIMQWMLESPE